MPVQNHIHSYVKHRTKPNTYRCDFPDCTHFAEREDIVGKYSLCTICGSQFILTMEDLRRVRPKCFMCSDTKKSRMQKRALELGSMVSSSYQEQKLEAALEESQEQELEEQEELENE